MQIIYQKNLEKEDFHNLKKNIFKSMLLLYALEINLTHATAQLRRDVLRNYLIGNTFNCTPVCQTSDSMTVPT